MINRKKVNVEIQDILKEYNIGNVIDVSRPQYGSNNTLIIKTANRKYVLKANQRIDYIKIQNVVNEELGEVDRVINKIIPTRDGKLLSYKHYALYDYMDGYVYNKLSDEQLVNALEYMATFNKKLSIIDISKVKFTEHNIWDKSRSLEYIVNDFEDDLINLKLTDDYLNKFQDIIRFIKNQRHTITTINNQIIHGDLGADNFIFDSNNQVIGIIDFTPEVANEHYSLAHFIYWNYLWDTDKIVYSDIMSIVNIYNRFCTQVIGERMNFLLLILASISRLIGHVLYQIDENRYNFDTIAKRLYIVIDLMNYWRENF